jgi:hypothetical protein
MATQVLNTEIVPTAVPAMASVAQLSFTGRRADDSEINLWSPAEVTGDWDAQCRAGREYGYEAANYIRSSGDAAMLGGVVRAIVERGNVGEIEAGFFSALSMSRANQ